MVQGPWTQFSSSTGLAGKLGEMDFFFFTHGLISHGTVLFSVFLITYHITFKKKIQYAYCVVGMLLRDSLGNSPSRRDPIPTSEPEKLKGTVLFIDICIK